MYWLSFTSNTADLPNLRCQFEGCTQSAGVLRGMVASGGYHFTAHAYCSAHAAEIAQQWAQHGSLSLKLQPLVGAAGAQAHDGEGEGE